MDYWSPADVPHVPHHRLGLDQLLYNRAHDDQTVVSADHHVPSGDRGEEENDDEENDDEEKNEEENDEEENNEEENDEENNEEENNEEENDEEEYDEGYR